MKPHAYAGMIYAWCIERIEHDKLDDWHTELNDLLPWQDSASEAAINIESESFLAMQRKSQ